MPLASTGLDIDAVRDGLRHIRACGVDLVDITDTWLPISEIDEADVERLASVMGEMGVRAVGVSLVRHSVIDPSAGPANLAHTYRAIEVAAALAAPVVSIGFHEPLPTRARTVPFWSFEAPLGERQDPVPIVREIAQAAAVRKVAIALELYEGGPLGSGRLAADMVERVGEANVGINLDVGNLYRSPLSDGETWLECVESALPVTNFWHVKNYRRVHQHPSGGFVGAVPATLGDGDIDYRRCLAAARAAGYQGPIIVEHYGGDGLEAQRVGVAYLERIVEDTWTDGH